MTNDPVNLTPEALEAIRDAQKEAIKEWLDGIWMQVGKWTLKGFVALLFAGFVYLLVATHGFGSVHLPGHMAGE